MKVRYSSRFLKDIDAIGDRTLANSLERMIEQLKLANSLSEVQGVKKMTGSSNAYRIRVGDYRLGFFLDGDGLTLHRFLHRKDIYRAFP